MNLQSFYQNLKSTKESYSSQELAELARICEEYPYFQLGGMLALKAMHQANDKAFYTCLPQVSTLVLDREVLFDFVYSEYQTQETKSIVPKMKVPSSEPKATPATEKQKSELQEQIDKRMREIEEARTQKQVAEAEAKPEPVAKSTPVADTATSDSDKKSTKQEPAERQLKPVDRGSVIDFIDKFIKANPGIRKPEDKDYQPEVNQANKSLEENYELVSETMAELYLKQGHTGKAKKIYEKLILIYPEKSTYFANRISEIEN